MKMQLTSKKTAINILNMLIEESVSDREWAKDVDQGLYDYFKGKVQGYKLALKIIGRIK